MQENGGGREGVDFEFFEHSIRSIEEIIERTQSDGMANHQLLSVSSSLFCVLESHARLIIVGLCADCPRACFITKITRQ